MNERRLQQYLEALYALSVTHPGVMDVTYLHDAGCPCAMGDVSLPSCTCRPILEVSGTPYIVDDAGNVAVLERN